MAFLPPAPLRPFTAVTISGSSTAPRLAAHLTRPLRRRLPVCTLSHTPSPNLSSSRVLSTLSRRNFLAFLASATGALIASSATTPTSAVFAADDAGAMAVKVVKAGKGPAPKLGDLVGIRFKASYNGVVFDNLFESSEPYFYRVGSESILKGIDETVQTMKVGDIFDVTVPSDKAFGKKGRRASAGKPSIPPDAAIFYTIELSTIPGREDELLEGLNDKDIGDKL